MESSRRTGTVVKRSGARIFILEDHQNPDIPEKDLWFISARRFRDGADGWKAKPGDRVSFTASNMMKRPNPVANDAFIISGSSETKSVEPVMSRLAPAPGPEEEEDSAFAFWRRCPICPGVVTSSIDEWESHLAGEEHGAALRQRARGIAPPSSAAPAPVTTTTTPGLAAASAPIIGLSGGPLPLMHSRFPFANPRVGSSDDADAPWPLLPVKGGGVAGITGSKLGDSMKVPSLEQVMAAALPEDENSDEDVANVDEIGNGGGGAVVVGGGSSSSSNNGNNGNRLNSDQVEQQQQQGDSAPSAKLTSGAHLVIPRHSPDEPVRVTVAYQNNFIMEYDWPDMSIPVAVLRKSPPSEIIRRQWLVQRLEIVMGEMDEQLPRTAFQNSATDWRDSFLSRLEVYTGERWTWKKIDGELCLGEGKSSATFWRALRVGIQSPAHANHGNVLVVKPANATQKMLFGKCHPSELPRSWEIPTHGKFIRLSFIRPELVYVHHLRLNNSVALDEQAREVHIATEIDVPSLTPMWRLDWRALMAMPEPIFPGAIHVVGSPQEAPRAIEKLVASVAMDGLIGLWGEWSGDTKGHEYNRLQVIQLATERCSVVFKVGSWKQLPAAALELFTHPRLRTVALGGQEITKKLRKDFRVDVTGGIDVLDLPAAQRCQPRSLKGLVGVFLNWNVGMDQAGSQWDAPRLTPGQLTHAATRPWLVLVLYRKILTVNYNPNVGVVEGTLTPKPGLM